MWPKKSLLMHFSIYANLYLLQLTIQEITLKHFPFSPLTQLDRCPLTSLQLRHIKSPFIPPARFYFTQKTPATSNSRQSASIQSLPTFVLVKTFQTSTQKHLPQNPLPHVLHVSLKTKLKILSFYLSYLFKIQLHLKSCLVWEQIDTNHF